MYKYAAKWAHLETQRDYIGVMNALPYSQASHISEEIIRISEMKNARLDAIREIVDVAKNSRHDNLENAIWQIAEILSPYWPPKPEDMI
jgi:hypothetical protein